MNKVEHLVLARRRLATLLVLEEIVAKNAEAGVEVFMCHMLDGYSNCDVQIPEGIPLSSSELMDLIRESGCPEFYGTSTSWRVTVPFTAINRNASRGVGLLGITTELNLENPYCREDNWYRLVWLDLMILVLEDEVEELEELELEIELMAQREKEGGK